MLDPNIDFLETSQSNYFEHIRWSILVSIAFYSYAHSMEYCGGIAVYSLE